MVSLEDMRKQYDIAELNHDDLLENPTDMFRKWFEEIEELEGIANSFPGVERSYAIQAGREVRIAVKPEEIDELGALRLSRDVVSRIQETMTFPGQIKVTVIRETRSVGTAR